jgi:hypothetical protein
MSDAVSHGVSHSVSTAQVPTDPSVWGPLLWKILHIMAEAYPEHPLDAQKDQAWQFFHSLGSMLPCERCRIHYRNYLASHGTELWAGLQSRDALASFVIELHNMVNDRLSKVVCSDHRRIRVKYQHLPTFLDDTVPSCGPEGPVVYANDSSSSGSAASASQGTCTSCGANVKSRKWMPVALGVTATLAVALGSYAVWHRHRHNKILRSSSSSSSTGTTIPAQSRAVRKMSTQ